jgi:hypothetical protein
MRETLRQDSYCDISGALSCGHADNPAVVRVLITLFQFAREELGTQELLKRLSLVAST